jgi:hypothetical protein
VIPTAYVTDWERRAPWPTREQIEQDLLLSRLIIEIANDEHLRDELVFRGGTCLHKLYLPTALRYSEDLDYVRTTAGGIGPIIDAVRRIGESLGMRVDTRVTTHPKIRLRAPFETGAGTMSIKIEINTFERSSSRPLHRVPFPIDSPWFTATAEVLTFDVAELVATKIRALYQRSKGRDLFDLWLALVQLGVPPGDIVEAFAPYRPDGYTSTLGEQNLRRKVGSSAFRADLDQLVNRWPDDYDISTAAEFVIEQLIARIE